MSVQATQTVAGIQFSIDYNEFLYYASAINGLPIITALEVVNASGVALDNVEVSVALTSLGRTLTLPFVISRGSFGNTPIASANLLLKLDSSYLFDQPDAQPGEIVVSLTSNESLIAVAKWSISVMPAETWAWQSGYGYLNLAAFVQPNSPLLRPILDAASQKMGGTGLSGYQEPERVPVMVKAIYDAVVDFGLTYSNPPASWDVAGQKIRLAHLITSEKVATCLDSALFFASLFEQVGLFAVIGVIPGHAFVGYWTAQLMQELGRDALPPMAELTAEEIVTFIDNGYLQIIETTSVTSGKSFTEAIAEAKMRVVEGQVLGSGASSTAFINIVGARRASVSVLPLPAKVIHSDGKIELFEYKPEIATVAMLQKQLESELAGRKIAGTQVNLNVPPTVRVWLDQLLDLTLRNPLINLRKGDSQARIVLPQDSIGHLEDQLQAGAAFRLLPAPDLRQSGELLNLEGDRGQVLAGADEAYLEALNNGALLTHFPQDIMPNKMRKIANEAVVFQEETGSNGLYLALGTLVWVTKTNQDVESPLILLPVKLRSKARGKEWMLEMDEAGVTPNFSLVEKLKQEYQLNLPHLADLKSDDMGIDVPGTFKYIRDELIKAGLTQFRIDERAILGMFNFSTYRLWRDLLDNWPTFEKKPLVKHLIHSPGEAFLDSSATDSEHDLDSLIAKLPISSDGSQARAIARALNGETFVLQGPPGTGKSQTIANLLSRALHEGKRVLFVAQKQDAAQVVKERLQGVGLSAFTLDLHDKNLSIAAVREQLAQVIDIAVQPDKIGFNTAVSSYETAVAPLANYRTRLHEENQLGYSIYKAKQKYLSIPSGLDLKISGEFVANATQLDVDSLDAAARKIAVYGPSAGIAAENPWSLSNLSSSQLESKNVHLRELLRRLIDGLEAVSSDSVLLAFLASSPEGETFQALAALNKDVPEQAVTFALEPSRDHILNDAEAAIEKLLLGLAEIPSCGMEFAQQDWNFWRTQAQLAIQGSGLFRGMKLKGLRKKIQLQLGAEFPGGPASLINDINLFDAAKEAYEKALTKVSQVQGLAELMKQDYSSKASLESYLNQLRDVRTVALFTRTKRESGPQPSELLHLRNSPLLEGIQAFASTWYELESALETDSTRKALWLSGQSTWARLITVVPAWKTDLASYNLTALSEWATLSDELAHFDNRGQADAVREFITGVVPYQDAFNAWNRGFFATMMEILVATRGFTTFNGSTIDASIDQVAEANAQIRARLPKILGAELLEQRGFNSSVKVGAIGDLVMAIKTARRGMTLKSMLTNHWTVIQQITPLVIASPDSCVRFIDANLNAFDLVVFDEASQLRVATTIGALGRANSAVIVGDSEQMPPTSVAQARFEISDEEEDDSVVLAGDAESILSMCVAARVPEIMLTWHYRSEDESLIAFSNHSYYKGNLNTFPSPTKARSGIGLDFVPVKGQFIRSGDGSSSAPGKTLAEAKRKGTNPAEALAIVSEIRRRAADPALANESVGVVTLNQQQQKYIRELLDTSADKYIQDAMENGLGGEPIFVKNLETVQGSERDVILFSVAFSSQLGKPGDIPLQFGPIINNGGHRRLNVAITRARKFMMVFCSFEPQLLISKKPNARGLQDLGQFLALAKSEDKSNFQVLASTEETIDLHRRAVQKALVESGLSVTAEVGLSDFKVDLAIMDPEDNSRAILAIMLDGARWNDRVTTVDRDVLPADLLKNKMDWPEVERIWLPAWLKNPQGEIDRIKRVFDAAYSQNNEAKKNKPKTPKVEEQSIFEQITPITSTWNNAGNPLNKLFAGVKMWKECSIGQVGDRTWLDHIQLKQVQDKIVEIADAAIASEGPVSPTRLAKVVASSFGLSKVVQNRVDAINGIFPSSRRDKEGFLFPAGVKPADYSQWQRGDESTSRTVVDISLSEIGNAMHDIAAATQGMRQEQLLREVINAFGLKRITSSVNDRLESALKAALSSGKLGVSGDYLTAV